ncbi:bifunctional [glutamate--ammonia ligase]-adenylyl-L-tyrosine phosphorylase/[glutamate--ammonia-ligase] adenylyltransferase [Kushneria phosphatilytica]|uniref:Bifunctional glutamine synthetase adenylyltransferase/adenylyl-removing enzyme n=1 Tax=Kushneria phosphatilytica TaxID=657387 RepID=A0A1S1NS07_9GAMM|nr:bifunctional [glutamate--ammonia ligase]-adenylyl-L-tyrosine phosphorylase/[glutamate--ammonia-ligase] adenylyltransferase [Kushneria phosphatilytica]OHV07678.1 bifunctional glutamine synthetase adenylyltransferase/deadenyltransferase [Kushneria phosphatilytica]QEL10175.1 bifunctional [glutamate--ammonia ligase]-adenylyl-L-tyrosine phosphorylase/[glutamate--ammonia-ligase] adenylyltransferase [Kushneria phosphatilytica]
MSLEIALAILPEDLQKPVRETLSQLDEALCAGLGENRLRELVTVLAGSVFVGEALRRDPQLIGRLEAGDELERAPASAQLSKWLEAALVEVEDEAGMHSALRRFRRDRMVGIIWRDRNDRADAWVTAAAVSRLAEVCVEVALQWCERHYEARWGLPSPDEEGRPQRLVVFGMGKLGAGELNLSSDIDLILAYPEKGETVGGRRCLDHQEYFTRLGQKLINALDAITEDGFVFRVDMRLRPLGEGGPLVGSFNTLINYYQDQGREWERYAMLKARPVAGDVAAGRELLETLRPFVYRRYIDFGAIESLREMKTLINREVRRRGREDDIKLGAGGIREAEFVVQAFQLIRGGQMTELQTPSLHQALSQLVALDMMGRRDAESLEADYVFLRDLEHALQALHDRQTQTLPEDALERSRLAFALGADDWTALCERLDEVRQRVRQHFDSVIAPEDEAGEGSEETSLSEWRALWQSALDEEQALALLDEHGFSDANGALRRIRQLRDSRTVTTMQRIGFERLEALMPSLFATVAEVDNPDVTLERVLTLIEAVLRRTAYLSLLRENPGALTQFVNLCAASAWIAEQLARHPMLLDELLDPRTLYSPAERDQLDEELRSRLARLAEDDEEAQMEALRHFRHAQILSVAASDIAGARTLMHVSDYLTLIAEVVLQAVVRIAWRALTRKYGHPQARADRPTADSDDEVADFLVVGYGKLGGIEMGYGSDLDLVFLHDAEPQGQTDGPRKIDNSIFFTRLGQRIIHMLTTTTPAGVLYEVDMRLRPSGASGLLVSTLEAFADYQRHQAWTWEHQALVRARAVAGSQALAARFDEVRREILSRPRDPATLREEVLSMRQRMREHLGSSAGERRAGRFHIKQDPGGMIDIEFMNQYAVLALSQRFPPLMTFTDNMRILETLESAGQLSAEETRALRTAWLDYRNATHRAALTRAGSLVDAERFRGHRNAVTARWQALFETSAEANSARNDIE